MFKVHSICNLDLRRLLDSGGWWVWRGGVALEETSEELDNSVTLASQVVCVYVCSSIQIVFVRKRDTLQCDSWRAFLP